MSKATFDCDMAYKACWLFVRKMARALQNQDFDIMAIEMQPEDYGGSFDPAVKERWAKICEDEIARFPARLAARFIEEEGPWGQGSHEASRDIAERLRASERHVIEIWAECWEEANDSHI